MGKYIIVFGLVFTILLPCFCDAFILNRLGSSPSCKSICIFGSKGNDYTKKYSEDDIESLRKKVLNKKLIDAVITGGDITKSKLSSISNKSIEMKLAGKGIVGPKDNPLVQSDCVFLSPSNSMSSTGEEVTCMPVPFPSSKTKSMMTLLSFAYKSQPISKSLCLTLSPILINRDGSLYDNLPWDTWTIDPMKRNVDAAGNKIDQKYHLGKRDAYNRFMGKDWYGRSLSIGNLAARAKYLLENDKSSDEVIMNEDAAEILVKRVLELEVKESRMAVAAAEEQLAIIRADLGLSSIDEIVDEFLLANYDVLQNAIEAVQNAKTSLKNSEMALIDLLEKEVTTNPELTSLLSSIIDSFSTEAPYRGAIGYKPVIDTKEEMFDKSVLPYSSPYELMTEIINEQLNANVIGCIIENTSLFDGGIVLGGALILQRKSVKKEIIIDGEKIEFDDSDDNLGNHGILSGDLKIIECDCDEAIGMAIANDLDISIEIDVWEKSQLLCRYKTSSGTVDYDQENENDIPIIESFDENIIINTQGDGKKSIGTPIQRPRDDSGNFMNFLKSPQSSTVFNSDIPVSSLEAFDSMTVQDKAQLLLSLDSFKGQLPRPRILRGATESPDKSLLDPLDKLLLPLIDESVRRQILTREAERKGATDEVQTLNEMKSQRQISKENAEQARRDGNTDLAQIWENEAEFHASLRADVTQDEGTYSTFLDRDEWYERERRLLVERNKKRFGSLLDDLQ